MKITIIGAGSSYTPELIEGLIKNYKYLNFKEIVLNDIEEGKEKANIILNLSKRMFIANKIKVKINLLFNKKSALKDSDFVIIQLRIGGQKTRIKDERIPLKYELLGQETNGLGGMFKALRTGPVVVDIVNQVKKFSKKNAWIICFSNPVGIVTELVRQETKYKNFVGICNVPIHLEMGFSQYFKKDRKKDLKIDWIGLNHLVFGTKVIVGKTDRTKEAISAFSDPNRAKKFTMRNVAPIPWEPNYIRTLGLIPCPYFRYFAKYKQMLNHQLEDYKKGQTRAEIVCEIENILFEKYKNKNLAKKPKELEKRGGAFYSTIAIEVLTALAGGPKVRHAVNTWNNGGVQNYPINQILEISANISKNKIEQIKQIKLIPENIKGIIYLYKTYELSVVKAIRKKDFALVYLAANLSPFTRMDDTNKIVVDELFEAHKQYLEYFKK